MNAAPTLDVAGLTAAPPAGLLRAIALRFDARTLAAGALIVTVLVFVGGMGLVGTIWDAATRTQLTRLVETTVTGIAIFIAVIAADELTDRGAPRAATYAVAVVSAAMLGAVLGWYIRTATGLTFQGTGDGVLAGPLLNPLHRVAHHLGLAIVGTVVGGLSTFVYVNRRTALAARRRQHAAERARALAQRRTLESRLQALQARVEPMFLFETLERIRALYRADAAAAGAMLEDLIVYLRAALPHLRESSSTVAQELELARSWLDILDGTARRWRVEIAVAGQVRGARLPALVLLPLVQRAVTGPVEAGARLTLAARVGAGRLVVIEVATSTDAFAAGIADIPLLEQIAARLHALYSTAAVFTCTGSTDGTGSRATISLPLELAGHDGGGAA